MKEFIGTQGYWYIEHHDYDEPTYQNVRIEGSRVHFDVWGHGISEVENKANAQLIAAAFDLLKACEISLEAFIALGVKPEQNCRTQVEKAINKAIGK